MKQDIREISFEELKDYLGTTGDPDFRAGQIFEWIYKKGAAFFEDMTNLPKNLRLKLSGSFDFVPVVVVDEVKSEGGTVKFLFDLKDHKEVESVIIPTKSRTTACISTQGGCKFRCKFCASGVWLVGGVTCQRWRSCPKYYSSKNRRLKINL